MPGLTRSGVCGGIAACCSTPLLPGFISMAASASGTGCGPHIAQWIIGIGAPQ